MGAICHSGEGWQNSDKHSWGDAGLSSSLGKRNPFFPLSSRHTGAAEYWSHSIKSGHMGVNYSSSEASPRAYTSPGYCSPGLQYLMLPIFDAAPSQQRGQSWCVWRRRDSFVWRERLKDRGKSNQANLCFHRHILFLLQRSVSLLFGFAFSLATQITTY